ncbi:MAG: hypothetical protein R3F11_25615 [Verrucomicrobiales bacterium]
MAGSSFSGTYNDADLAPGTYSYAVVRHYLEGDEEKSSSLPLGTATITGNSAAGTLLFDETISAPDPVTLTIAVTGERALKVDGATVASGSLFGTGSLELKDANLGGTSVSFSAKPVVFSGAVTGGSYFFAHPQDIASLSNASVRLLAGSGLSSFSGCQGLRHRDGCGCKF